MTTDVKLLPLPDELQGRGKSGAIKDYARANMAELLAENERMRKALRILTANWGDRSNTVLRQARDADEPEVDQYYITAGALAGCAHELRAAIDRARGKGGAGK